MPLDFSHNADLLSLPAAIPPLDVVCRAARWRLMGAQGTLAIAWQDYGGKLSSDDAALAGLAQKHHSGGAGGGGEATQVRRGGELATGGLAAPVDAGTQQRLRGSPSSARDGAPATARSMEPGAARISE